MASIRVPACRCASSAYTSIYLSIFLKNDSLNNLFSYFLALLGLRCCLQALSSCDEQGLLFIAVPSCPPRGPLLL